MLFFVVVVVLFVFVVGFFFLFVSSLVCFRYRVKDLRETNAQLLSTVSDLEAQVTNLTTQLNITEGLLAEVTEQLENICPNTSALQGTFHRPQRHVLFR